jgi:DNA-binding CsgD family transcriptional regulator
MKVSRPLADSCVELAALAGFRRAALAVGGTDFIAVVGATIRAMTGAQRWYFFQQKRGSDRSAPVLFTFEHEAGLGSVADEYGGRFFRSDPINDVLEDARDDDARLTISVEPDDIRDADYRTRYLEQCNIVQRLSLAHAHDEAWHILNIGRDGATGELGARAISDLWVFSQLVFPLVERHCELTTAATPMIAIGDVELQVRGRYPLLTRREAEVSARTVMGMSCKSISRDLGIGVESVATYRKRAYIRLGVSSAEQLSRRIFPGADS